MRKLAFAFALLAAPAAAHEFDELNVASVGVSGGSVVVQVNDTVAGQSIVCAVYDSEGNLIASDRWSTDNLATRVFIMTPDDNTAARADSARCVFND